MGVGGFVRPGVLICVSVHILLTSGHIIPSGNTPAPVRRHLAPPVTESPNPPSPRDPTWNTLHRLVHSFLERLMTSSVFQGRMPGRKQAPHVPETARATHNQYGPSTGYPTPGPLPPHAASNGHAHGNNNIGAKQAPGPSKRGNPFESHTGSPRRIEGPQLTTATTSAAATETTTLPPAEQAPAAGTTTDITTITTTTAEPGPGGVTEPTVPLEATTVAQTICSPYKYDPVQQAVKSEALEECVITVYLGRIPRKVLRDRAALAGMEIEVGLSIPEVDVRPLGGGSPLDCAMVTSSKMGPGNFLVQTPECMLIINRGPIIPGKGRAPPTVYSKFVGPQ